MKKFFEMAIEQDVGGNRVEAADLYERALEVGIAPLDAYLNLAVLYWEYLDPGHPHVSEFYSRAARRYKEVLGEADVPYTGHPEVEFWRLYFDYILLGNPPFEAECRSIVKEHPNVLMPYFYLYSASEGQEYQEEAQELLRLCKMLPTTKNRYVGSVIEAARLHSGLSRM